MSTQLKQGIDWPTLARKANYSTSALAELRGVSVRNLERKFLGDLGQSPARWLTGLRLHDAHALLQNGASVKAVASAFGYHHYLRFRMLRTRTPRRLPTSTLELSTPPQVHRPNAGKWKVSLIFYCGLGDGICQFRCQ